MNILSCGAGMQSTALALISCDQTRNKVVYPQVPRYDAIIYCDLGCEPAWVADQVRFIERACVDCNIPFTFSRVICTRTICSGSGGRGFQPCRSGH